ncbi:MAG: HotDog domain-containing protein [Benjaminiella poitrasii]|nr:MAG: HotDog domain-containing protein [Benjaminiella poitrasii]
MPVEGFKVDVEKAVGHVFESEPNSHINVSHYIIDNGFTPLPTYPLVLLLKGDDYNVNLFKERAQGKGSLPGMPYYDPNKIVHGEQSLEIINPFPVDGGKFSAKKTCTGVYDKGSGMVIETTVDLYDEHEKVKYCSMVSKSFVRGYGGWNGPKGPKAVAYPPPKRNPDAMEVFATAPNQALIYRLSGDYNPLHADTALAPTIGFPRPILHGLCTYGACGHAIIKALADNDSSRFKSIEARFASPVFPGETIEIYMWKVDSQDPKTDGVIFVAKVKERDVVVVNNGYATLYKKSTESKL